MSKVTPFREKPRYPWLAEIIRIDTPAGARESTKELSNVWIDANKGIPSFGRKMKRLLIKSASEAIRRSKAQLARKQLSANERTEFKEIIKIYQKWLRQHRLK